jgi:hypothetical protein
LARHLLRVLERLEALHNLQVTCFFIRTYHNEVADWLTREELPKVRETLAVKGWKKLEPPEHWGQLLNDAHQRLLRIPGETGTGAGAAWRQLERRRQATEPPCLSGGTLGQEMLMGCAVHHLLRNYETAWRELGGVVATGDADVKVDWLFLVVQWTSGKPTADEMLEIVHRKKPSGIVVDMPSNLMLPRVENQLRRQGYTIRQLSFATSSLGDPLAVDRKAWVARLDVGNRWKIDRLETTRTGTSMQGYLLKPKDVADDAWRKEEVEWGGIRESEPLRPLTCGRVFIDGESYVIHHVKGPGRNPVWPPPVDPRGVGNTLIGFHNDHRTRPLRDQEIWRLKGGTDADWHRYKGRGFASETLLESAALAAPLQSARAVTGVATAGWKKPAEDGRAGVCFDPDDQEAYAAVRRWLAAWKRNKARPDLALQQAAAAAAPAGPESERAGAIANPWGQGGRRSKRVHFEDEDAAGPETCPSEPEELLNPRVDPAPKLTKRRRGGAPKPFEALARAVRLPAGRERESPMAPGALWFGRYLEELKLEALMARLSEGTRDGYEAAWRQWVSYRRLQERSPFLEGADREERRNDEEALITFAVYLARIMERADSTVRQKLYAIRYAHLVAGYSDPLLHRTRLWATMAGLKRMSGGVKRKLPVTPTMLRWLQAYLKKEAGLNAGDCAVIWAAIVLAFFFMLRASEYLVRADRTWSTERVLFGEDVVPRVNNKETLKFAAAEELIVYIKGSKTDQYNVGAVRNHYRSGDTLCPLVALQEMQRHFPQRFLGGKEAHLPLFRWTDGSYIGRDELQSYLQVAAAADGREAADIGSHSLRIGGATAMAHVVGDLAKVQRFGRWSSDAFHAYIWDGHQTMEGVATQMAGDATELTKPRRRAES